MQFDIAVFEAKNLTLSIGSQNVVDNVSFVIKKGEYAAIIGPNGGGKTSLMTLLLGLRKPTSGKVFLFGVELSRFKEWSKIGYVPQRVSQIDKNFPATVFEVIKMGRVARRGFFTKESHEDLEIVQDAMEKMDVVNLKEKLIGELSGGQRQRVMIARALASQPEVLILDEPNTGVDMASQTKFYALLKKLNTDEKLTILFVTHDIGVIADDITQLLCINQRLLSCSSAHEALSCENMSKLYGIDAHVHKHIH